jgi:quercetin 2,3-dioxygenase
MIAVRSSQSRGKANFGWLDSHHTFSFGQYHDPKYMGFASLRVINEDKVIPGEGFPTHGHRDMEIVTYVLQGALEHKDSLGTGSIIYPGDVQRMSAGTGIQHSEYNPSATEPVHLLQIWILPDEQGITPSYEQKHFALAEKQGKLRLVAARDGRENSVTIHQDANIYAALLSAGDTVTHHLSPGRVAWLQVAGGKVQLNDTTLVAGDGAAIEVENSIELTGLDANSEILLFDLAA